MMKFGIGSWIAYIFFNITFEHHLKHTKNCWQSEIESSLYEPPHDKTNKMSVRPAKTQISLGIFAVCMKKAWVLSYPLSAQRRLWPDWADAQADLSLCWEHTHFVGFVMSRLNYIDDCFFFLSSKFLSVVVGSETRECWSQVNDNKQNRHYTMPDPSRGNSQGTSVSCPFDQQQNMLWPTIEYFIKTCLFCCHDQQQNADTSNNRMPIFVAFCCWSW